MQGVQWTLKRKSNQFLVFDFDFDIFLSSNMFKIVKFICKYTIYGKSI